MSYNDYDNDIFDEDDDDDTDDDFLDDEDDDEEEEDDVYDTLEYMHTCHVMTKKEIIADIKSYLRRYQPEYKVVRKKEV